MTRQGGGVEESYVLSKAPIGVGEVVRGRGRGGWGDGRGHIRGSKGLFEGHCVQSVAT